GVEWSDTYRPAARPAGIPPIPTYGQPLAYTTYPQQQYGAAAAKNNLATAGLTVSIISVLIGLYGIASIVGIALSAAGLTRASHMQATGGFPAGKSAAMAGLIVGIVSLVLNSAWIAFVVSN